MMKPIKSRVFDEMEVGKVYTRKEIVQIYRLVTNNYGNVGNLATSLCRPYAHNGYFCQSTSKEPRYILSIGRNQFVLCTDE